MASFGSMDVRKVTVAVNAAILIMVFGLMGFFYIAGAEFMVWFSIPTALVYVLGFVFLKHDRLDYYVRLVYTWLPFYMCVATVCVGYKLGFHLYVFSMVPTIFYSEYVAKNKGLRALNPVPLSCVIVFFYLLTTGYTAYVGPIYEVDTAIAGVFWIFNSLVVCMFIVFYMNVLIKNNIASEEKLKQMALFDRLTGLYNRHYMMSKLEKVESGCLAMIDIDDFKKINDHYGHNAGDYILTTLAKTMREVCPAGTLARWGGEEFLIYSEVSIEEGALELFEKLRSTVESGKFVFEDQRIKVTITVGLADKPQEGSIDRWVMAADRNLYDGKKSGKNKVVT